MASTRSVYQERFLTTFKKDQVIHKGRDNDLILNTAQMRDAYHLQRFRIPSKSLDEERVVEASVGREVSAQKQARRVAATQDSSHSVGGPSTASEHVAQHPRLSALQTHVSSR